MDILTHICSGAATATVVAAFAPYKPAKRLGVVAAGAFGGALPDMDAISMWSGFDATIGRLFHLSHSGREIYGGTLWYSHHGFFHSIAAALLFAILLGLISWLAGGRRQSYLKENIWILGAFVAGYIAHILGDFPTPASVWGGVSMFWPSETYVGGSGKIWWWNNYDIFLLFASCALINTAILSFFRRARKTVLLSIAGLALILVLVQVNTRQFHYAYKGNTPHYAQMEQHSKQEQERILGKKMYRTMEWIDQRLPMMF